MSDALESAEKGLKGKIGPVPVWMIAAVLGIVSVGGYYLYSRKAGVVTATADTSAAQSDTSGIAAGGTDSSYSTVGLPAATTTDASADATVTSSAPSTNAGWLVAASTAVAGNMSAGYIEVFTALTKYLNGDTITSAQSKYVEKAIALEGYPPELPSGLSTVADPVSASPATTGSTSSVPATATTVKPRDSVQAYGVTQAGIHYAIRTFYPFSGSPVSEQTAKANGVKYRLSGTGRILAGPGVTYVKLTGTPQIYAVYSAHSYHLSAAQYVWLGKPAYQTVSKLP